MFEHSLAAKIIRVASALERSVETELKVSFELTFSQFRVLSTLKGLGEASQKDVAVALEVTPAVVTRQAEVLAGRGLLTQKPNPLSKRENILVLTKKGEGAVVDASKVIDRVMNGIMEDISLQDETALKRGVEGLSKRFA